MKNQQLIMLQRLDNIKKSINTATNELKCVIGAVEEGTRDKFAIMDDIQDIIGFLNWTAQQ